MPVEHSALRTRGMPVLVVTGGTGQIGFELIRELAPLGTVIAPTRSELDLARPQAIKQFVRRIRPDMIVNAGAYTAVDNAESDRETCFAVNATAPGALAEEALRIGAALIHYSTDYVFDGAKRGPYVETDEPSPVNVYGESKLIGERAVAAVGGAWIVLRTSWVYGLRGQNFLMTILRLARERQELRVVDDQIGAPTWSRRIAEATREIVRQAIERESSMHQYLSARAGCYHLSASGATSWCNFARAILALDPRRSEHRSVRVTAIRTADQPSAARRPHSSLLDGSKLASVFEITLPSWEAQLQAALAVVEPVVQPNGEASAEPTAF